MSKLIWLRSLVVPIIILSILFVAFVGYYLYWVPNRQRHLDDRGFRYLNMLSDQIRLTINTYDRMMDYAVDAGVVTDANLQNYLGNIAPQLVVPDKSETKHPIGGDYDDPPKIAVEEDEGTHFLYLAFSHDPKAGGKPVRYAVRTDLDKLINGLLGPPNLSPFDVVLAAQGDGKVIFQKSLSGIEVAQIKNLEDASGEIKGKTEQSIDIDSLSPASRLEEVKIAGARYRLYSQPLQIGFLPANPTGKSAEDVSGSWVLCGLVRADRFRSESQLIPYAYILTILAVILLAAAAYPFLRLYLSSPGERLWARDVTTIAIFACLVTAVLTFVLADAYYWNNYFGPAANGDMERLANAINENFEREKNAAYAQLDVLDSSSQLHDAIRQADDQRKPDVSVSYSGSKAGECQPSLACRVNLLVDNGTFPSLKMYPYPFFVFWSDRDSNQRVKWTTRQLPTPFVPLDDPSVPYYPDLKRHLKDQGNPSTIPAQGIGSQYSPTTGQNITVFWKIIDEKMTSGQKKKFSASLVTQPISLFNSVLPGAFQFAVLTPEGAVVFHSDPTRNLRENFFAETDQNPDLRSRVKMRAAGPVVADYLGKPHRMYVQPMNAANQDGLWTIVVFRDLHLEETMNLEILSLVSIMFILYAGAITLVLLSAYWIRGHATRAWFWPDSRKGEKYAWMAIANLIAVVLLLVLSRYMPARGLLICAGLIPAAVLLLNLLIIAGRSDIQTLADQASQTTSIPWQSAYFGACATFLVVVAVVPCLCFFKVAANFEHKLFVERTQLQLAADLENRALSVQSLYQDVRLGEHTKEVLAGPEHQHAGEFRPPWKEPPLPVLAPVFSYHELLNTRFCSGQDPQDVLTGDWKEAIPDCRVTGSQADEDPFLSAISLSYNERAADDWHLAEDKSDMWKWTLSPSSRNRTLQLTMRELGQQARVITTFWEPFYFPWDHLSWWLGTAVFLTAVYWLTRLSLTRIFLLNLIAPPAAKDSTPGLSYASLMADLPMNLLIIGPESCRPITTLIYRSDVQVYEAEALLEPTTTQAKPKGGTEGSSSAVDQIDGIIRDRRPLVLRNFERLQDTPESSARTNAVLMRVLSCLGNSVIIISELDPLSISSIEASERWRILLRSFVRIDLNSRPGQRVGEDDADYQSRISADSYFHWLFSGLSKPEKLVMLQLAQEKVVNPNSWDIVSQLMELGMIERRWGLLMVKDDQFAKFLERAIPHNTVKHWEKQIAGTRPVSLQTSLLVLGVGVVAFLVYTQGDVFNTWVTYATGLAASVPKALQLFDSFRPKSGANT